MGKKIGDLLHVWFDVDNTLYKMSDQLEARILDAMYDRVSELLKISLEETRNIYDTLLRHTESHTASFKRLGLSADEARKTYNSTDIQSFVQRDPALVQMFNYFAELRIPCSIYSNSYMRTIDAILHKLGLESDRTKRFAFKIPGEAFPKTEVDPSNPEDTAAFQRVQLSGFGRIIELTHSDAGLFYTGPDNILFVGDREKIDIRPAKLAGMRTARVMWGKQEDTKADYKLEDIYQLRQIVESLVR